VKTNKSFAVNTLTGKTAIG